MSSDADAPLVGYNTNFRHRERLFHVQTEDSGAKHPHVITHVFTDGGRVIATRKISYAHLLERPDRADVLRRLMKEQHKAMLLKIRQGSYDQPTADHPKRASAPPAPTPAPPKSPAAERPVASPGKPIPSLNELILRYLDEELNPQ